MSTTRLLVHQQLVLFRAFNEAMDSNSTIAERIALQTSRVLVLKLWANLDMLFRSIGDCQLLLWGISGFDDWVVS